jgi:hypothetical protein
MIASLIAPYHYISRFIESFIEQSASDNYQAAALIVITAL